MTYIGNSTIHNMHIAQLWAFSQLGHPPAKRIYSRTSLIRAAWDQVVLHTGVLAGNKFVKHPPSRYRDTLYIIIYSCMCNLVLCPVGMPTWQETIHQVNSLIAFPRERVGSGQKTMDNCISWLTDELTQSPSPHNLLLW